MEVAVKMNVFIKRFRRSQIGRSRNKQMKI